MPKIQLVVFWIQNHHVNMEKSVQSPCPFLPGLIEMHWWGTGEQQVGRYCFKISAAERNTINVWKCRAYMQCAAFCTAYRKEAQLWFLLKYYIKIKKTLLLCQCKTTRSLMMIAQYNVMYTYISIYNIWQTHLSWLLWNLHLN